MLAGSKPLVSDSCVLPGGGDVLLPRADEHLPAVHGGGAARGSQQLLPALAQAAPALSGMYSGASKAFLALTFSENSI